MPPGGSDGLPDSAANGMKGAGASSGSGSRRGASAGDSRFGAQDIMRKYGRCFHLDLLENAFQAYDYKRNTSCDTVRSSFPLLGESICFHLPFQQTLEVPKNIKEGGLRNWRKKFT
jgi:hypothetical protein